MDPGGPGLAHALEKKIARGGLPERRRGETRQARTPLGVQLRVAEYTEILIRHPQSLFS